MRYFDSFAGIGGFSLGIQQAYEGLCIKNKRQGLQRTRNKGGQPSQCVDISTDGLTCIGYSEIDKYATQIYEKHFPTHKNYGDITKIDAARLPDFDMFCGGFPCQSFSIAGKRGGFEDTRGTLFFEIARILRVKRPRIVFLENVKGLLSHDEGNTFATIISTLDELGYDLQWQVLNSKNFGVPQNRERVFIIGHLRGTSRPKVFPIGRADRQIVDSPKRKKDKLRPVMLSEHRTELGKKTRRKICKLEGRDSTLRGKEHKEYRPNSHQLGNCLTTGQANIEKWILPDDVKIRRLTPTECERLQGFPDGWTEGVSDTQRYKCLGNAVTVNVIRSIVIHLTI